MNLKKKGFQLPDKIRFDEETLSSTYGKLIAEPLERGFGTTMGNSLRRVLLSSLEGAAVSAVKITGALHEFSTITGVKEDVIDIILNLKKLRFKFHGEGNKIGTFNVKGPGHVTGADLQVDSTIEVLNPETPIATLDKGGHFDAEIYIRKGKGYIASELNQEDLPVGMIAVDAAFTPLRKVNFWVEKTRVGRETDYDRLIMEIWTDGSISPEKAISQAASIVIEHMDLFIFEEEAEDVPVSAEVGAGHSDRTEFSSSNDNLFKNVDELELSVRSFNCLKNANIKTIIELVQKTEPEMLKTKNFGRKSLNEIKEILGRMGLHLGMKIDVDNLSKEAVQSGGIKQNAS
ncbi:MAG TPA: DNA-directed RNA polymerase subunit alpha [Candidatus Sulfobium mesophilum]|uniref:DNA-directed RNA polymerase subunit alpha n=1 Tax=Candidatus Sulfobium mesophilum TaxID=2016548 RepID=A0A2U3QKX7_9BACT|nr:RNA polymerase, alpha subunit [Candidatus Sulfobium mesophilum]HSB32303.1 DNA-directed RNA polymerase subunit alpha [Candidatus Sulfobium mesophilum]